MTYRTVIGSKLLTLKGDPYTMKAIARELRARFDRTGRVEFAPLFRHAYYGPIMANVEEGSIVDHVAPEAN
jgi:hypothetical protein